MTITQVPLVDLSAQHAQVTDLIREGMNRVIAEGSFVLGPAVAEFEKDWAQYCGTAFAVGVGNGTDAVELALRAHGIGPGDDVIVPANTFVATAGAVHRTGATVVPADCDEDFLLSPQGVQAVVTPRTKAVIGVHLFGQTAPMEIIRNYVPDNVLLVEDMAQSQGASRFGRRSGTLGDVAATSFYPGKNLGAFGDAGAVMTDSIEIDHEFRQLRNHGGTVRYQHNHVGFNSRLDSIQAVVLSAKLKALDTWNQQRRDAAAYYDHLLADMEQVTLPRVVSGNEHVFHLYVVRVADRNNVLSELNKRGVAAGVHYPTPVHLLPAYEALGLQAGSMPIAEKMADEILSLPLYPGISPEQQEFVATQLRHVVGG